MVLKAQSREVVGKKVKNLRAQNMVPASVYGPKQPSLNIALPKLDFIKLYKEVGYSNLFELEMPDGKKFNALLKEVQFDYLGNEVIHVSIYKVDMEQKIVTNIPLTFTGVSLAIKNNLGLLVTPVSTVEITCLPGKIPSELVVDISKLDNVGDNIFLKDIDLGEGVELVGTHAKDIVIASIAAPQKTIEEETPAAATTEAAAEGEAAPAETTEEE
ncbi:MAG TPA: 50S ribosomal protein L25 [Candidatus Dojkabacteria bacterium]|jgi:large subunit ribosomal protein L25|nr:50S ribosomal protein L25 [Candidatus Dojkabacteria bacterium]